jgi:hypothetical protein
MIYEALNNLGATAEWCITNNDLSTLQWLTDGVQPTEAEITAEVARLQAEYDNNAYQRQRATAYPSIADQLDTIYHEGLDAWKATILAVKEEFPK